MSSILALVLAAVSLFGGSSDLLDYVSTESYWQSKQVDVSVAAMSAELDQGQSPDVAGLIDQLSSDDPQARTEARTKLSRMGMSIITPLRQAADSSDPEVAGAARDLIAQIGSQSKIIGVRRLMAIRALGELGDPGAIAVLKPLLKSPEMFEPDYAAAAIARLEHRAYARPMATDEQRVTDAWNLPQNDQGVLQISGCGGTPTRVETLIGYFTAIPRPQQAAVAGQVSRELISVAESIGNFRVQLLTVSIPEPIGNGQWNATVVLRGWYDSQAVAAALKKTKEPWEKIDGQDYFQSFLVGMFMPGDDRMVFVLGQNFNRRQPVVQAVMTGKQTLRNSQVLAPLITAAGKADPVWGVLHVTPAFRAIVPMMGAFDTFRVQGKLGDGGLQIRLSAAGHDPAGVARSVGDFNATVARATAQARQGAIPPANLRILGVLQSVQCQAEGPDASASVRLPMPMFPALENP